MRNNDRSDKKEDKLLQLLLIDIPMSVFGCCIMWSHRGPVWGILTGLLSFGLIFAWRNSKKSKS